VNFLLTIKNLDVSVQSKEIIHSLSLSLEPGSVHVIMGPNGAGKSTLALAIMGYPGLKATGSIKIGTDELIMAPADIRAKKGMFLAFQNPEEIEGVKVSNLMRKAKEARNPGKEPDLDSMVKDRNEMIEECKKLGLNEGFITRDVNLGFSGGEKKRLEILQMITLKPKVAILDEPDSGLDVDGVRLIADAIQSLQDGTRCFLIITHYPRILKYITPDRVHILSKGRLVASGGPELAHKIEEKGYSSYVK